MNLSAIHREFSFIRWLWPFANFASIVIVIFWLAYCECLSDQLLINPRQVFSPAGWLLLKISSLALCGLNVVAIIFRARISSATAWLLLVLLVTVCILDVYLLLEFASAPIVLTQ